LDVWLKGKKRFLSFLKKTTYGSVVDRCRDESAWGEARLTFTELPVPVLGTLQNLPVGNLHGSLAE
jgi:hypothetical protein